VESPWIAIGVLVFAFFAEGASLLGCLKEVNKVRYGRSLWYWFRETRHSELLVVFGEDLAALLGLTFALVALFATMITGDPIFDAMGSIVIGLLLIIIAILVGVEVKALLVGQGVEPMEKKSMVNFLQAQPGVSKVFNLLTLQMGTDVMVAVKAKMVSVGSDRALIEQINLVESAFRTEFPQVMWLFFEPDIED
jgi:divalent metal cation (Fe/Co/Zn/Cd) transporter